MRVFNSLGVFALFAAALWVLCCISTSGYALTYDVSEFRIPPNEPIIPFIIYPLPVPEDGQAIIDFVLPPGVYRPTFTYPPKFRNPLDIDWELSPPDFSDFINSQMIDSYSMKDSVTVTAVPEPSTLLLLGFGAALLRKKHSR